MDWVVLPKGVLLGVSIAAPVGPIGVLTIRRTLTNGFGIGLATGFGAATADAIYGCIAAFGLTAIMSALVDHADGIRVVGGLMLIWLGVRGLMHAREIAPNDDTIVAQDVSIGTSYAQAVGLTLTNPLTILSFVGMFAGVGIVERGSNLENAVMLVAGVGLGSAIWWVFLCSLTNGLRSRLPDSAMKAITLCSSAIIATFGLAALIAAR